MVSAMLQNHQKITVYRKHLLSIIYQPTPKFAGDYYCCFQILHFLPTAKYLSHQLWIASLVCKKNYVVRC